LRCSWCWRGESRNEEREKGEGRREKGEGRREKTPRSGEKLDSENIVHRALAKIGFAG
jgi:hypothetical protein